jgi:hypothetical protein
VSSNGQRASRQSASRAADEMVERLEKRWPNHKKVDADQLVMYHDDIAQLIAECGEPRVRAAEEKARTHCNFLPEPAELRELLPAPEQFPLWRDPECPQCHGSGWFELEVPSPQRYRSFYPTIRVAQRCYCEPPRATDRKNPEGIKEQFA